MARLDPEVGLVATIAASCTQSPTVVVELVLWRDFVFDV